MSGDEEPKLIAIKKEKLKLLKDRGEYYPNDFSPSHSIGEVRKIYDGKSAEEVEACAQTFRLAGRVTAIRDFGGSVFFVISQNLDAIQVFIGKSQLGADTFKDIKRLLDVGDIVGIEGKPFITKTGELTINAQSVRILVKSLRPLPEKWHGLVDPELRYRQRYLDLIVNKSVREIFVMRSQIIRFIRDFLRERGFLEVETPMMQPIAGGAAARPFVTHHNALDVDLFLRIAPELYLKRLLVGGFDKVFEIGRCFRNEGISTQHNPEFTMCEFYWAYATFEDLMSLIEQMIFELAQKLFDSAEIEYQGQRINLSIPFARIRLEDAVEKFIGLPKDRLRDAEFLKQQAERLEIDVTGKESWGELLYLLFEKEVEHKLIQPTFVTHFPVVISPLARRNKDDSELVDRFELFIAGREMANAFSELNDPQDQRSRFEEQLAKRQAGDEEAHMMDEDFITALEFGMPPAAGAGLGIDRLVMLFCNVPSIREVILFPQLRPKEMG